MATPQVPRRTGRAQQAPDSHGEWVNTQQVLNPETQIWYVLISISSGRYQRRMSQ